MMEKKRDLSLADQLVPRKAETKGLSLADQLVLRKAML